MAGLSFRSTAVPYTAAFTCRAGDNDSGQGVVFSGMGNADVTAGGTATVNFASK